MDFDLRTPIVRLDKTRIAILKEKIENPNISARRLSEILGEKYGIVLSRSRIAEIIKEMKDSGVFRETVIPNEKYFIFSFMEMSFNNENFTSYWRETYEYLIKSSNVMLFFTTDGRYRWKLIMAFRSFQEISKWVHEFLKEHGTIIQDLNMLIIYKIHKFKFDEKLLEDLLEASQIL